MDTSSHKEASDDEIHFGKITIKEIKKMYCNRQGPSKKYYEPSSQNDLNSSFRLIETHSVPNLRSLAEDSPVFSSQLGSPASNRKSDDSFIELEDMVTNLCISNNSDNVELNNTLEVIDYILNHGPKKKDPEIKQERKMNPIVSPLKIIHENNQIPIETPVKYKILIEKQQTTTDVTGSPNYCTPAKSAIKKPLDVFATPSSSMKSRKPVFKTPANPSPWKKPATPRGVSGKINSYQHITSPIASYIKNTPQVPLVTDVHPKKTLLGASFIPKLKNKSIVQSAKNKENIHLPSVAYKSAKITKVVHLPDEDKLPQSQWVKKITSSFPRPTVMKHEKREMNPIKKRLLSNQEQSFANLSCHQAEVSLCTEKTAFKSTKKH